MAANAFVLTAVFDGSERLLRVATERRADGDAGCAGGYGAGTGGLGLCLANCGGD